MPPLVPNRVLQYRLSWLASWRFSCEFDQLPPSRKGDTGRVVPGDKTCRHHLR